MDFCFKLYFSDEEITVWRSSLTGVDEGSSTVYKTSVKGAEVVWKFEVTERGTLVDLSVAGNAPLYLKRIDSLRFGPVSFKKTDRVLSFSSNMRRSEHRFPCELPEGIERFGDCTGHFADLTARGMALAMVAPFRNVVGAGALKCGDTLEFFAKTEFTEGMQSECALSAERVFYSDDVTVDELYDIYRSFLPQSSFPMPKLVGWNTWDYYLARVTPEDIFENIDAMSKMPFADKLDYVVIDDGWQKEWGIWVENDKFACGLDYVAGRIKEAGFLPGIWMAPLLMKDTCEGFENRHHWFCRNEKGEFVRDEGKCCLIDPTVPEAEEFILNNYRYLYSCGYRLFKIDYLSPLVNVKSFYDKNATAYSALSKLILKIREATGPDAVILGCSLPVQCGADIAPSMRIGVDIHNHFGHAKWIAESLSWTWMYNNKTTRIDPDFLVVRGLETANEGLIWEGTPNYRAPKRRCDMTEGDLFMSRWRQGDQFNAVEAETWAYLVSISGGNIFLSDRMSVLNERGICIISRALDMAADECRPHYLADDARLPSLWTAENRLLLVNWEDIPMTKTVDCGAEMLESDKEFTLENGKLTVTLLPHESFYAIIK